MIHSKLGFATLHNEGGFLLTRDDLAGMVIAIGDAEGNGPSAFDWRLRALLAFADDIALITVTPTPEHHRRAVYDALAGRVVAMVATTPGRRAEWLAIVAEAAPSARLAVISGGASAAWAAPSGRA